MSKNQELHYFPCPLLWVHYITADTEEACKAQADAILKFAKPKSYPGTNNNNHSSANTNPQDAATRELVRNRKPSIAGTYQL